MPLLADGVSTSSGSDSTSGSFAGSQVNLDSHDRSTGYGSDLSRNVPNVIAPSLTTSNETCMGSTSGGVTIAGFGITAGSTWSDSHCRRRLDARQLHSMGYRPVGFELMCVDDDLYEAAKRAGMPCVSRDGDFDEVSLNNRYAEQHRQKVIELETQNNNINMKMNRLMKLYEQNNIRN